MSVIPSLKSLFLRAHGWTIPSMALISIGTPTQTTAANREGDSLIAKPNIVFILADDLGFGDVRCYNIASKIPTPNLDRLATQGMRFTDAHAPAAMCTPSRYAILTGRYSWRNPQLARSSTLQPWEGPLIPEDRMTVASMLRDHGYQTAAFGKWHLGWQWPFAAAEVEIRLRANKNAILGCNDILWHTPIASGPTAHGFNYYFGVDAPNFPPYAFIENDRIVGVTPTEQFPMLGGRMSQHAGPGQAGFDRHSISPMLTQKISEWIRMTTQAGKPIFMYLALTSPHSPIIPNSKFKNQSGVGDYGDFVMEMDATVGAVMLALREAGIVDNTLVIFTSDNGPENWAYEDAEQYRHYSMGEWRGVKRDAHEGGHRVPFIAVWPGRVPAGSTNEEIISQVDFMATVAALIGVTLPNDAGEDSYNILPALTGEIHNGPIREATVYQAGNGSLALREKQWVYIDAPTGLSRPEPDWFKQERGYKQESGRFPGVLYDLSKDPTQRNNVYALYPETIARLKATLDRYERSGRSAPLR